MTVRSSKSSPARALWLLPASAIAVALSGCSKPPPPPPPPPPAPAPPPPEPEPIDVQSLLERMQPAGNVSFASDEAPVSEALAEASIRFADAFSRGSSDEVSSMLSPQSRVVLDELVNTFRWDEGVAGIEGVRIVSIDDSAQYSEEPGEAVVATAIQERTGSYILLWQANESLGSWVFNALPATSEERPNAHAWDGTPIYNLEPHRGERGGVTAEMRLDFFLRALPQAVRDQLSAAGFDPAAMTPDELEELLDSIRDQIPAEFVEVIEELIKRLRSGGSTSSGGSDDEPEEKKEEEKKDEPIRKNTPGGPITIPNPG